MDDGVANLAQEDAVVGVVGEEAPVPAQNAEGQAVDDLEEGLEDDVDEDLEGNNEEVVVDGPVNNPNLLATSDPRPIIKLKPFEKFVRSLTEDAAKKYSFTGIRMQSSAFFALHTAAEDYLVSVMKEARIHSEHAGHDFLTHQDFAMGVRVVGMGGK